MSDSAPRVSIVTPNYNGGRYLKHCIDSIVNQLHADIEHIIVDGGSTDNSSRILADASGSRIIVEPDSGQYDAINKGMAESTGEIMGWLNSDDWLIPGAIHTVVSIFRTLPAVEWLTTSYPMAMNAEGSIDKVRYIGGFNARSFYAGANVPFSRAYTRGAIQQESTFWRRSLWERAGGRLSDQYPLAGDFELWARFFQLADLHATRAPIGCFRYHRHQRSVVFKDRYLHEARSILSATGHRPPSRVTSCLWRKVNGIVGSGPTNGFLHQPKSLIRALRLCRLVSPAPIIIKGKGVASPWRQATEYIV